MRPQEHEPEDGIREVNMTPLIDVSLVLVVMLLLATPLAFESSIAVKQARAAATAAQKEEPVERVEVRILDDEHVRVNRREVSRSELGDALTPLLLGESPPPVVVTAASGVSHGTFVSVLDQAKFSGAAEIAVTGE
jgi:biopolymer transport protein ExbD